MFYSWMEMYNVFLHTSQLPPGEDCTNYEKQATACVELVQ